MKLIVAHLPNDAFEPVRARLLDLGVYGTTISEVRASTPPTAPKLQYRGAAVHRHMRPELRLECLVTAEQSPAVVDLLREHASRAGALAGRIAVLEVEELHPAAPEDHIFPDDPRLDTVVC